MMPPAGEHTTLIGEGATELKETDEGAMNCAASKPLTLNAILFGPAGAAAVYVNVFPAAFANDREEALRKPPPPPESAIPTVSAALTGAAEGVTVQVATCV
jgi:hypothetical protein